MYHHNNYRLPQNQRLLETQCRRAYRNIAVSDDGEVYYFPCRRQKCKCSVCRENWSEREASVNMRAFNDKPPNVAMTIRALRNDIPDEEIEQYEGMNLGDEAWSAYETAVGEAEWRDIMRRFSQIHRNIR